jgi:hypothetical protein
MLNMKMDCGLENLIMKTVLSVLPTIALASAFVLNPQPSLANCGSNGKDVGNGCSTKGAPAPLIGVGLPGLAIGIGYGAYLITRRRRTS